MVILILIFIQTGTLTEDGLDLWQTVPTADNWQASYVKMEGVFGGVTWMILKSIFWVLRDECHIKYM